VRFCYVTAVTVCGSCTQWCWIVLLTVIDFLLEIVDGNLKMTLGMIWTIILRFAIQDINVEGKPVSVLPVQLLFVLMFVITCCT